MRGEGGGAVELPTLVHSLLCVALVVSIVIRGVIIIIRIIIIAGHVYMRSSVSPWL